MTKRRRRDKLPGMDRRFRSWRIWSSVQVFLLTITALSVLVACGSSPDPARAPEPQPREQEEEAPVVEQEEAEPEETPEPEAEEPAEEPEQPEEPAAEPEPDEDFEVTEEVYEQTFTEVERTIQELNEIIQDRDFEEWRSYLTDAYETAYSDEERLREISDMPILQRNDIVLESLRDYFRWVVVPSRANARLDDLRFVTDDEVEAIMSVNGQRVILYHLKKVNGSWKIDTS